MKNIVNLDDFEKLLIVNWTKFIDTNRFITFILSNINSKTFTKSDQKISSKKNFQTTVSQFKLTSAHCFNVWVDFILPKKEGVVIGTCEIELNFLNNEIKHLQTTGNLFDHI